MPKNFKNITLSFDGNPYLVEISELEPGKLEVKVNGISHTVSIESNFPESETNHQISHPKRNTTRTPVFEPASATPQSDLVSAPMPGDIIGIDVRVGDQISVGQKLLVLEAMKMKNIIRSPQAGKITEIEVAVGQSVKYGDPLVRFK